MRHQDLTANHILESWVYANAGARNAATGFVTGDIGRICYQADTGQYWRLTSTTPTWQAIDPLSAYYHGAPGNPSGTTNTTGVMMGLAMSFAPTRTGKVLVIVSGTIANNTASDGAKPQIRYGTGAAPGNGAALTGTSAGTIPSRINNASTAADRVPFTCVALISGLTVGSTTYWFDLSLAAITAGTANVYDITYDIVEL